MRSQTQARVVLLLESVGNGNGLINQAADSLASLPLRKQMCC